MTYFERKYSLWIAFVVSVSVEVLAVDRVLYVKYNYSCRAAPKSNICPDSGLLTADDANPFVFNRINTSIYSSLIHLKKTHNATRKCLDAVKSLYCETRFGKCELGKATYNTSFVQRNCNIGYLARSSCSSAVQKNMYRTCRILKSEVNLRKETRMNIEKCKKRNETTNSFCPSLSYKVFVLKSDYLQAITETEQTFQTIIKPNTTLGCYGQLTELVCATLRPICTEDEQFVGYFLTKEMCLQRAKCYKHSKRNATNLILEKYCQNLPSSNASTVKMEIQDNTLELEDYINITRPTPLDMSMSIFTSSRVTGIVRNMLFSIDRPAVKATKINATFVVEKIISSTLRVEPSHILDPTSNLKKTIERENGAMDKQTKIKSISANTVRILSTYLSTNPSKDDGENSVGSDGAVSDKNDGSRTVVVGLHLALLVTARFCISIAS